eukprot:SAG31_NODE_32264_length_357_cov_10.189922_1_plen_94_part_10
MVETARPCARRTRPPHRPCLGMPSASRQHTRVLNLVRGANQGWVLNSTAAAEERMSTGKTVPKTAPNGKPIGKSRWILQIGDMALTFHTNLAAR